MRNNEANVSQLCIDFLNPRLLGENRCPPVHPPPQKKKEKKSTALKLVQKQVSYPVDVNHVELFLYPHLIVR